MQKIKNYCKEKRTYFFVFFVPIFFAFLFFFHESVFAFSNGINASNGVGQLDSSGNPSYTRSAINNSPRPSGLSSPNASSVDESGHRLFVSDSANNRVLVFNLDSSDNLLDYTADAVLGQSNLITGSSGTTQSTFSGPDGLLFVSSTNQLFVSDATNNRVMVFDVTAITNGENATKVLGQSSFTASTATTTQSGLSTPAGLFFDSNTSLLFVADLGNNRVMVFDVASITDGENAAKVLGQPNFTTSDADVTQSKLSQPIGLAFSTSSLLFVSDLGNNRVMVFDVASITNGENATKVLGQADFTSSVGDTTQSNFNTVSGLSYASSTGMLYVADTANNRIMVFDVIAITNGENAAKVLGQANFTSSASGLTQGTMALHAFSGLSYDNGNSHLFVADYTNNRVMVFDVASITNGENAVDALGQTNTAITSPVYTTSDANNGVFGDGFGGLAGGVVVDTNNHRLFFADYTNNRVLVFNLNASNYLVDYTADAVLGQTSLHTSTASSTQSTLIGPYGLAYDSTNTRLFVADSGNNRVMVFDVAAISDGENAVSVLGQANFTAINNGTTQSTLFGPTALTYDSTNSFLFVADGGNNRVMVFDVAAITNGENATKVLGQANFTSGGTGTTQPTFNNPYGLAYDSANTRLFVSDLNNNRIMVFDLATITNGENAASVLGQANFTSSASGLTQGTLNSPYGLAYNSTDSLLYLADSGNNRVMVFDVASITNGENAANVLGQSLFTTNDAAVTQSGLTGPLGLAYNSANTTLWVADGSNRAVEYYLGTVGVTLTQSGGSTAITEAGATDTFTVVLTSPPTSTVTFALSLSDSSQLSLSTSSISFTSSTWNTAVTVTTTPTDDSIAEGNHTVSISYTVTNSGGSYNGLSVSATSVSITDNDTAGITVTQSDGTTTITEGSTTDSFTVVLDSAPTSTVTIAIATTAQATISTSSLQFSSGNWSTPVTVTVTAVDDSTVEGSHTATISFTVTSNNWNYNAFVVSSITATITDNDTASTSSSSGGGGSTTAPTAPDIAPAPATTDTGQLVAPVVETLTLPAKEQPLSVSIAGESHTFTQVGAATDSQVTITIQSEPVTVTLLKEKAQEVDLNKDGKKDIRVLYKGLKDGKPQMDVVALNEVGENSKPISINKGASSTMVREVLLSLRAKNAPLMAISENKNFASASFVPFADTYNWTLSDGAGEKTVYVRFRSSAGGTVDISDSILYQPVANVLSPIPAKSMKVTVPTTPKKLIFVSLLRVGSKSNEVAELQKVLQKLGFMNPPKPPGLFGPVTKSALMKFQKANRIDPVGYVGPATRAALNKIVQ